MAEHRKAYSVRLNPDDVTAWDIAATERGMNRTQLIESAIRQHLAEHDAITLELDDDTLHAWLTAAKAAGQTLDEWISDAARRRLEYGDQPPPADSHTAAGRPGTDSLAARMHRANTPRHAASSAQAKAGIQPIKKMGEK